MRLKAADQAAAFVELGERLCCLCTATVSDCVAVVVLYQLCVSVEHSYDTQDLILCALTDSWHFEYSSMTL